MSIGRSSPAFPSKCHQDTAAAVCPLNSCIILGPQEVQASRTHHTQATHFTAEVRSHTAHSHGQAYLFQPTLSCRPQVISWPCLQPRFTRAHPISDQQLPQHKPLFAMCSLGKEPQQQGIQHPKQPDSEELLFLHAPVRFTS